MRNQKGFTLIELVVVIVILGILAAVAVPKFIDIQNDAEVAAANGVFGAASAATGLNHAAKLVKGAAWGGTLITDGDSLVNAMEGLPDGWAVDNTGGAGNVGICLDVDATVGDEEDCSTSKYFVRIDTLETNGATKVKAVLAKAGTVTVW